MSADIFKNMIGITMTEVDGCKSGSEVMKFTDEYGDVWTFYHAQDCCENVAIDDVVGDADDLVGSPLLTAEVVTNIDEPPPDRELRDSSFTWTFYKFATIKGSVTVKWLGESNGYYSEGVDMREDLLRCIEHEDCRENPRMGAACHGLIDCTPKKRAA